MEVCGSIRGTSSIHPQALGPDTMLRIGIFFGGTSREREISFAGGRTVYDNLDQELFEPVPIFVDSWGNFIHLQWKYLYQGTIREFYPGSVTKQDFPVYIESLQLLLLVWGIV